jgi:hypothetical protein
MDLIAAVRYGTPLTPQLLETHKLDKTDTDGMTALHIAVILTRADAVWSICTSGACPVLTNKRGYRPIDYATSPTVLKIIKVAMRLQPYSHVSEV